MNIQITPKKAEGSERLLEVSVPVETVRAAEESAALRYASQVRLPGFRPGKAPAAMVRKKFADAIRQQAVETLVQDAYKEVLEREKLTPIAQPHVHDLKFEENQPLTFELHVEVRPEIALPRTGGFRIARPATQITDEMVQEQLEALRDQKATWTPVDSERPAPSDMVTVLLSTADENGGLPDEGKEYRIVLGGGQAIAGVEELIMEAMPGATVERPVKWPDDFADESQRGVTKLTRVTLVDVKRKSAPALDEAFARASGDFDSIDALTSAVRTDMEAHFTRESESQVRQQLIDEIVSANPFDVPRAWVTQLTSAYADAYKIPEAEREKFTDEFRTMAERQVRRDLVIDTVSEREGLAVTEADVDARVQEMAEKRGTDVGQLYSALQKAGRLREIERSITEDRVFAYLMSQNTVE